MMEELDSTAVSCSSVSGADHHGSEDPTDQWDSDDLFADETVVLLNTRGGGPTREVVHHRSPSHACSSQGMAAEMELSAAASGRGDRQVLDSRDDNTALHAQTPTDASGFYVLVAACMAALGGMLFGYDAGIVSGALLQLRDEFDLSCFQQEMVVSTLLLGAVLASLTGGYLIDYFGRRPTIIANACVFVLGAIILATSTTYPSLILGRVVVGFAVSLSATAECIYISEISPPKRRGFLVSLNELGITLGFLSAYLINFILIKHDSGWRYMFGLSAIPGAVQCIGMVFLPPSPRYLLIKQNETRARQVLLKLHGAGGVDAEVSSIKLSVMDEKAHTTCDLFRSGDNMNTRMFIAMGLVFLQQCTCQPSVLYYAPTVFKAIGFHSDDAATLATVGLGTVKVISTVVAILCIDKVGRRKFLLFGACIMTISIVCLGAVIQSTGHHHPEDMCDNHHPSDNTTVAASSLYPPAGQGSMMRDTDYSVLVNNISRTQDSNSDLESSSSVVKWTAFVSLTVYIAGYALSFGPGTWLVLSEIFPAGVKGRAISLATVLNYGTNLVVAFTFLDLMNGLGVGWTFIVYGIVCAVAVLFIFCMIPETKGKTLEQISQELNNRSAKQRLREHCRCSKYLTVDTASYQRVDLD